VASELHPAIKGQEIEETAHHTGTGGDIVYHFRVKGVHSKDEGRGQRNKSTQHGLHYQEHQECRAYMEYQINNVISKGVIPPCYLVQGISHIEKRTVMTGESYIITVVPGGGKEGRYISPPL
ncbi:MAG TPA: hypothetical protein DCR39_02700, partial [Nitrospiraceae bacterium]|nr:hypothetical protein [Nitrospiraceae bacterium]